MKYTIRKHTHYCTPRYPLLAWGKSDVFDVTFSKECVHFQIEDDIHKLWGRSNTFERQIDSLRIGWRSDGECIELFAYEHLPDNINGNEKVNKIGFCYPSQKKRIELRYTKGSTYIFINDTFVYVSKFKCNKIAFRCLPMYGGDITAPNDMDITITRY